MSASKNFGEFGTIKEETCPSATTYKFTWIIKHFPCIVRKLGKYDESRHFFTGANREYEWSIDICLAGVDEESQDFIGIRVYSFRKPTVASINEENIKVYLSILDNNGEKYATKTMSVAPPCLFDRYFIPKSTLLNNPNLLLNGALRLSCEIFDLSKANGEINAQHSENSQLQMLRTLFDKRKFSDFKLVVEEQEFSVHRAILAAKSAVFEAMFDSNMRESSEGKARIDDLKPEIMDKLLRFVYTDEADLEDSADEVLVAAEKYQIDSLKSRCEGALAKKLSADNVFDILLLFDQNNAAKLKKEAIEFFDANLKILRAADNFEACVKSLPGDLKAEIICIRALNA